MAIFKTRPSKKFNYQSRFYNNKSEGSPYEIKHKFDKDRKTANPPKGLKAKFSTAFGDLKTPADKKVRMRILIIIAILLLIVLYIIDFDLSIFKL